MRTSAAASVGSTPTASKEPRSGRQRSHSPFRGPPHRRFGALVALAIFAGAVGCSDSRFGAPRPASEQGSQVLDLWRVLFLTGTAVGLLVVGLILWSVVRYRRKGEGTAPQFRDNVRLEIFYTAVPLVIVAVLFGITLRTQSRVTRLDPSPDLRVDVTGFQWGWHFRYPEAGVTVAGDSNRPPTLVLPLGRTVQLGLASADVVHAFFVPAFLNKADSGACGEEEARDHSKNRDLRASSSAGVGGGVAARHSPGGA